MSTPTNNDVLFNFNGPIKSREERAKKKGKPQAHKTQLERDLEWRKEGVDSGEAPRIGFMKSEVDEGGTTIEVMPIELEAIRPSQFGGTQKGVNH